MPKFIDYNRYLVAAALLGVMLAGCALITPKTNSPVGDGKERVNHTQLDQMRAQVLANRKAEDERFKIAYADLERKQGIIDSIAGIVVQAIPAVPGPWGALVAILPTLLAGGAVADNARKNGVIKTLKKPKAAPVEK